MIKAVKNTTKEVIEIPFEFRTYILPINKAVLVSEALHKFIEERFPLAFSTGKQLLQEKDLEEVKSFKTKSYAPTKEEAIGLGNNFMKIHNTKPQGTFSTPDGLPPSGVDGWYGEGVEKDTL